MNKLLVTSVLLALSTLAVADPPTPPTPPTPPHPPSSLQQPPCARTGGVLFEQKIELEPRPEMNVVNEPTWAITVYDGGVWTRHDVDGNGRNPRDSAGCMPPDQLATIRTALAKAPWTVKHTDFACAAISNTFTSYTSQGKALWADHMCQTTFLDETSAKAIQTISTLLAKLTAPHTPPCCKN